MPKMSMLRKTIGTIDMEDFLAGLKNRNGVRIVDVREPSEFNTVHVARSGECSPLTP
jgi:hypothetical protein